MTLEYWYVFPVAILIATVAMASGVGGATFFSPFFIIVLGLPPEVAIGTGLITEVFGFASGLYAYARKRLIDYRLGLSLLVATIPLALVGTLVAGLAEPDILKVILGVGLFAVAFSFLRAPEHKDVIRMDGAIEQEYGGEKTVISIVIFTVPGVIIGVQLGSIVAARISQHTLEKSLGILFAFVGAVTLAELILKI